MKQFLLLFCILFNFTSCEYFDFRSVEEETQDIIAIVNTHKLFRDEIKSVLPENIGKNDSIVFVKSYINSWALKQLLLSKAEQNATLEATNQIDKLVNDYRESLLINSYKEMLINQQLDTVISLDIIKSFYEVNKENFRLNEDLVKLRYLYFENTLNNKKDLIKLFKKGGIEEIEELEKQQLSFKKFHFDENSWLSVDEVLSTIPISRDLLLNKTKYLEKQDSIGLYLVAVKDILVRNDTAPLSYIKPQIKQMILHRRKIEMIKDIEKIILQDATKNNNFKTY